jgi:hypothetical protein
VEPPQPRTPPNPDRFQGENWSPNGEARDLILAKGLRHTSMSVGDVIEDEGGIFLGCAPGRLSLRLSGSESGVRQMRTNRDIPCKRHNPIRKALRSPHLPPRPYKGRTRQYDRAAAKREKPDQ